MITDISLEHMHAKVDRCRRAAERVVAAMRRRHLDLLYSHGRTGATWRLSIGKYVAPEVAAFVICNADVTAAGDALFSDVPSQTFHIRIRSS